MTFRPNRGVPWQSWGTNLYQRNPSISSQQGRLCCQAAAKKTLTIFRDRSDVDEPSSSRLRVEAIGCCQCPVQGLGTSSGNQVTLTWWSVDWICGLGICVLLFFRSCCAWWSGLGKLDMNFEPRILWRVYGQSKPPTRGKLSKPLIQGLSRLCKLCEYSQRGFENRENTQCKKNETTT